MGSHLGILRLLEKYSDLAKKGSVGLPKIFFFQKKKILPDQCGLWILRFFALGEF